jgi:hypothetical protein
MRREECWNDSRSLEPAKMTHIQTSTGSQYRANDRNFGTAHGNKDPPAAATPNVWIANRRPAKP